MPLGLFCAALDSDTSLSINSAIQPEVSFDSLFPPQGRCVVEIGKTLRARVFSKSTLGPGA